MMMDFDGHFGAILGLFRAICIRHGSGKSPEVCGGCSVGGRPDSVPHVPRRGGGAVRAENFPSKAFTELMSG